MDRLPVRNIIVVAATTPPPPMPYHHPVNITALLWLECCALVFHIAGGATTANTTTTAAIESLTHRLFSLYMYVCVVRVTGIPPQTATRRPCGLGPLYFLSR